MNIQPQPTQESPTADAPGQSETASEPTLDLIGGPYAVIESDPGKILSGKNEFVEEAAKRL